jgi:hypothetical protein
MVSATSPGGAAVSLAGQPDAQANLDWYAFDQQSATPDTSKPPTSSVIPGNVRFRGMPNARWWDFEGSKTDFGAVIPDARDLSKLLFMDFLLLHGDDWLLAPLDVATGSLAWIDALTVTDVFGVATVIPRADAATAGARWTMYSTLDASSGGLAQYLVVPSSASAAELSSAPVEEVHLLRDETADLAWAIEHIVEGPTALALQEPLPPPAAMAPGAPAPLEYQLATPLPASWFPLLPRQTNGVVSLVVGTVEGAGPPLGRIVHGLLGLQLPDAEVPRSGVQVRRVVCRARSHDGRMHLWVARRTRFGAGAASSSLRYDLAQPAP